MAASSWDPVILNITDDSRQVGPGSLFVARLGHQTDGQHFIRDALKRGAVAILTTEQTEPDAKAIWLLSRQPALDGLALARRFHQNPTDRLTLIGITGTNGKTTVAYMIRHLLHQLDHKCGLIGTVEIDDGDQTTPAHLTTPGAIELVGLLHDMVRNGCTHCVMEVSSHALDQERTEGVPYAAAVFTNLSGDHLDYHRTLEAYATAKASLFASLSSEATAIVNADDAYADRMVEGCAGRTIRYGTQSPTESRVEIIDASSRQMSCRFDGSWGQFDAQMNLIGQYNAMNLAAAVTTVAALVETDSTTLARAMTSCPHPPGRLERVTAPDHSLPFEVFVDYAHTDDALANVLQALRPLTQGKLRVLFGCGGDRDRTKRARMAAVACDLADSVVVTSDNPRTEDPLKIIDDILVGIHGQTAHVVPDRTEAIEQIIQAARPNDTILIAGKGHEDYQILGSEKFPFDDREEAAQALRVWRSTR
jgi:UDP-N-acetylmuramoyl-L-alanyl-D-glutamate--2,6-diaminopimelate ligase